MCKFGHDKTTLKDYPSNHITDNNIM